MPPTNEACVGLRNVLIRAFHVLNISYVPGTDVNGLADGGSLLFGVSQMTL